MGNTNRVVRAILAESEKVNCDETLCEDCEFEKFCKDNYDFYYQYFNKQGDFDK